MDCWIQLICVVLTVWLCQVYLPISSVQEICVQQIYCNYLFQLQIVPAFNYIPFGDCGELMPKFIFSFRGKVQCRQNNKSPLQHYINVTFYNEINLLILNLRQRNRGGGGVEW